MAPGNSKKPAIRLVKKVPLRLPKKVPPLLEAYFKDMKAVNFTIGGGNGGILGGEALQALARNPEILKTALKGYSVVLVGNEVIAH